MTRFRTSTLIALAIVASLGLAACENTIRGAGRDVGNSVDAVEDATGN